VVSADCKPCGAFLFHDPCLGHLPEVIADRSFRNLQPASDIRRGQDPVDLEQTEDLRNNK
jgi:hypothetical protein